MCSNCCWCDNCSHHWRLVVCFVAAAKSKQLLTTPDPTKNICQNVLTLEWVRSKYQHDPKCSQATVCKNSWSVIVLYKSAVLFSQTAVTCIATDTWMHDTSLYTSPRCCASTDPPRGPLAQLTKAMGEATASLLLSGSVWKGGLENICRTKAIRSFNRTPASSPPGQERRLFQGCWKLFRGLKPWVHGSEPQDDQHCGRKLKVGDAYECHCRCTSHERTFCYLIISNSTLDSNLVRQG